MAQIFPSSIQRPNKPARLESCGADWDAVKVIIIDDDAASVRVLQNALADYAPEAQVCGTALDLDAGRRLIEECEPDIVFLDIAFPESEDAGLDIMTDGVLQSARGAKVVFYTSYRKYLMQALRLQAFDFLLKPFDAEELSIIMNRYFMQRGDKGARTVSGCDFKGMSTRRETKALSITTVTNDRIIVAPSAIVFFKYDSERKLWEVVLSNLQRHILKRHTTADTILGYGPDFIRTHKTYIINLAYLGMITTTNCTLLPPFDSITEIKISKNFRRQLLDRFYDL